MGLYIFRSRHPTLSAVNPFGHSILALHLVSRANVNDLQAEVIRVDEISWLDIEMSYYCAREGTPAPSHACHKRNVREAQSDKVPRHWGEVTKCPARSWKL